MVLRIDFLYSIVLLSIGFLGSCSVQMPSECAEFYNLSPQAQEQQFPGLPLKRQLEIYRCEMKRKPPNLGRAYDIANGGEEIIAPLLSELGTETDELAQYNFIYILQIMSRKGLLRGRDDIVLQIKEITSRMKYSRTKELADKAVSEIERNVKVTGQGMRLTATVRTACN